MKIVIAMDSFKGSLSSLEAGKSIARGIRRVDKNSDIVVRPLADGGEGTVETLVSGMNGIFQQLTVTGPLGGMVFCEYGIIPQSKTAIIEMSSAAGITLVKKQLRNPLYTTTYGVGEIIKDAIQKGCRHFIIGIGGSATNDGGIGMLQALGYEFLDKTGHPVEFGAKGLKTLHKINTEHVMPELAQCKFRIACDVSNPLCGKNGCSVIFAPQKGADPDMISQMDQWMLQYSQLAQSIVPETNPNYPGTGAAGGLGFAFLTFTNATLESGIQIILDETNLESHIKNADVVITGEGRLDGQTSMGKAPVGVAHLAKKYQIPVLAFAGSVTSEASVCNQNGIDAFFPTVRNIITLEEAMDSKTARENLADTAEQVFRLLYLKNHLTK